MTASSLSLSLYKGSRFLLLGLLFGSLMITGCASKYGKQTTKVNHYPDCYAPIAEMRKSEYAVEKSTAGGALVGALVGAAAGYLVTGKASGAAVGAAAGGAVGGAAGYYKGSTEKKQQDAAYLADYSSQLDGDITAVDKAAAGAKVARQCYERQFTVAVSEFKAGHLTKEQFNSRYTEVTSGMEEAATILGMSNKNSAQVLAQYNRAIDQESGRLGVSPNEVRAQSKPQQTTSKSGKKSASKASNVPASAPLKTDEGKELTKMATKTASMERSVNDAQEEERLLRERLSSYRQTANDLMS